ncbi:MAG TPA: alpha/beta fold hydrolase [Vicinamibacterales bacterium]|nr:alpha/beta fold hydrolase [Vicinamibacterales bacterium]
MPVISTEGATIAFDRAGSGPDVLLIQGVGVIGRGWQPQIDGLAREYSLWTFDNRGIGGSTTAGTDLSIEAMARDALAVMDANGVDRFHLVGHSMGGVIAQEVALRATPRVRSLCLMCTVVRGRDASGMTLPMILTGLRTRIGTRAMRRNAFLELVIPGSALKAIDRAAFSDRLGDLFGHDLADQPAIVMPQIRAMARYDARDRLSLLKDIPTLVMSGAHDRIAQPASGRALAAMIPGARYVEYADAGHGLPIQHADRVNAALRGHFEAA